MVNYSGDQQIISNPMTWRWALDAEHNPGGAYVGIGQYTSQHLCYSQYNVGSFTGPAPQQNGPGFYTLLSLLSTAIFWAITQPDPSNVQPQKQLSFSSGSFNQWG